LRALELAQAAWDGLQNLYDVYDALKGLVSPQPKLPDEIKDPLSDALGLNENGSSNIYVEWSKLTSRPFSTNGYDLGI
jgi:hypothetical protein